MKFDKKFLFGILIVLSIAGLIISVINLKSWSRFHIDYAGFQTCDFLDGIRCKRFEFNDNSDTMRILVEMWGNIPPQPTRGLVIEEFSLQPEIKGGNPSCWLDKEVIQKENLFNVPPGFFLQEQDPQEMQLACIDFTSEDARVGEWLANYSFYLVYTDGSISPRFESSGSVSIDENLKTRIRKDRFNRAKGFLLGPVFFLLLCYSLYMLAKHKPKG